MIGKGRTQGSKEQDARSELKVVFVVAEKQKGKNSSYLVSMVQQANLASITVGSIDVQKY